MLYTRPHFTRLFVGTMTGAALMLSGCSGSTSAPGSTPLTVSASDPATSADAPPTSASDLPTTVTGTVAETVTGTVAETVTDTAAEGTVPETSTPSVSADDVLGPFGLQGVTLGMSPAEASATGVFVTTPTATVCELWSAAPASALDSVSMSPDDGIAAIWVSDEFTTTAEGVAVGWTAGEIAQVYPTFDPATVHDPVGPRVPVPGNPQAVYRFLFGDTEVVQVLVLELADQPC